MSYPRFIENEGWGLVANTKNAAIFQIDDDAYPGEPKILISYADGTLLEIPRWLPNVNPAMGGLGQGRALDIEQGWDRVDEKDEFQAPEFYNQNILMELQDAIRIPIPKEKGGQRLTIGDIWNTRQRVNPGRRKSEIDDEIDQILFEQRDYFGDISPDYILSGG